MNACRVLLADDHTLVRAAIRSLLLQIEGIEIVAEACSSGPTWRSWTFPWRS
jgi:DNA-binding NarL/FixJ family response regulator